MTPRRLLLSTVALGCLALALGCSREQVYEVEGVVRTELENDRIVIQHAEIPGYMPAMTMAFTVADRNDVERLRSGDRVRFQYRVNPTRAVADNFEVIGREPSVTTLIPRPAPKRLREGDVVPPFDLLNEQGAPLTAAHLQGQWTVLTFIFTRCPVPEFCPALALRFGELQHALRTQGRSDVRLLSLTLDPEFDRPDILRAYGEAVGADPEIWNFATGNGAVLQELARAFTVYTERNGVTLDHTLCTALIDPDGRIAVLWRGHGWKAADVLATLPPSPTS